MKIRIGVASLLALAIIFALLLPVHAGSISDNGWGSDTAGTSSGATATLSEGKISLSAEGYKSFILSRTRTATIKLTNNTGSTQVLSGEMKFAGSFGSYTITLPNIDPITGGSVYTYKDSITLENGQSLTISITSPGGSGEITCEYAPTVTERVSKTITCNTGSNGSYSINGTSITADNTQITYNVGDSITLEPTPASDYVCLGFMLNETTLLPVGQTNSVSWSPTDSYSIKPVFAQVATSSAPFKVDGIRYYTWETAMAAAGSSGVVVLAENFTLPATYAAQGMTKAGSHVTGTDNALIYHVPAGVSLLIPYDDNNLTIQASDADAAYANYKAYTDRVSPSGMPEKDVYRSLTIPSGTTVTLANGSASSRAKIVVGGGLGAGEGTTYRESGTYGNHGNLVVNGDLKLGSYSVLSTCGYVIGGGDISTTGTGAAVYQPMVVSDWRGAAYAALATNTGTSDELYNGSKPFPSGESSISPFSQWGFINIRVNLSLAEGNTMSAYCSLLEDTTLYTTTTDIVGSAGLLRLAEGASLTSQWQANQWELNTDTGLYGTDLYPYPGQNKVTVTGGATLGTLDLTVSGNNFSSANFTLPLCYNFDITLSGSNSSYTIGQNMLLLPGASLTVADGANLNITASRFVVLDGATSRYNKTDNFGSYAAAVIPFEANKRYGEYIFKCYPTAFELRDGGLPSNGEFIVNGTLSIGASTSFGGLVQSAATGATISVGGTDESNVSGSVMHGLTDSGLVNLYRRVRVGGACYTLDAKVLAPDGSMTTLQRGKTYNSLSGSGYLIEYFGDYYYGITSGGALDGEYNFMNEKALLKSDAYPNGQPINGKWCAHEWANATCTKPKTCTLCGTTTGDLLDHSYGEGVVTDPTCTDEGFTTYTCSACGDSYIDEKKPATGHSFGDWTVVTPATCTTVGEQSRTCVCGETETEEIPAGHTDADGDYICDICSKKLYLVGWTSQLYLIEPWALRLNVVVVDENTKEQINTVSVDSFYFLRSSDLGDTEATVDTIKNHEKTAVYSGDALRTQSDSKYTYTYTDYKEGIYTYQMDEDIYAMASFTINSGDMQYVLSPSYNLKDLLKERKVDADGFGAEERSVYTAMYSLWEDITAYREGKTDSTTTMGTLLAENQLGAYAEQTDYKFGVRNQIVLIEPWGLQVNAAIVPSSASSVDDHIDYSSAQDYGVVMFYDVDGTYSTAPSADALLAMTGEAYVFSKDNGAFVNTSNDSYIAARYNRDVYTYQLNTNVYALYFVKVGDNYYYSNVRTYNVYDLAKTRSADEGFDTTEREVYGDMVALYDAITAYRAWVYSQ